MPLHPLPFDVEVHQLMNGKRMVLDTHRLLIPDLVWIRWMRTSAASMPKVWLIRCPDLPSEPLSLPPSSARPQPQGSTGLRARVDSSRAWTGPEHSASEPVDPKYGKVDPTDYDSTDSSEYSEIGGSGDATASFVERGQLIMHFMWPATPELRGNLESAALHWMLDRQDSERAMEVATGGVIN